ncbi:MAG TPA: hypothetical protein VKA70_16405 [Blastocatellia bacterium]|nr:hypothetical protein [Blastocatellia bacterium]
MLEKLTRPVMAEQLNSKFQMFFGEGESAEVELVEVEQRRSTPKQEQFAAVFRAPASVPAQQGLYRIKHEVLGEFEILLVPFKRDNDSVYFEAYFNRLI